MMKYVTVFFMLATVCIGATPNILVIVCDDQGAETCVPYGGDWATPNIDSIRTSGMMFTECHSCLSCGPSRATLMTSRYSDAPNRLSPIITTPLLNLGAMSTDEVTVADVLGGVGYSTCNVLKWNLRFGSGNDTEENRAIQMAHIQACGFDTNFCFIGNTIQYWGDTNTFWGSDAGYVETNYFPYLANQFALDWMDNATEPFYLQYNFGLVHQPFEVTPDNISQTNESNAVLVEGMYTYMDKMVSNLLANIPANTLIIYTADNGTDQLLTNTFNSVEIAGGKQTQDETATKVPFYIQWDGVIATNSIYNGLTSLADVMPTLAEIAGASMPTDRLIDGKSFYQGLLGNSTSHRTSMFISGGINGYFQYKNLEYKVRPDNDTISSIGNWPYGDGLVSIPNAYQATQDVMLNGEYFNETNKAYGDTPWGGHSNEVFYAQ